MQDKIFNAIIALAICAIIGFLVIPKDPPKEQIKPVECLTYYQWEYLSTKRNNILEKLYNGNKSKRKELTDSLNKYNRLLGLDETLNVYPER